MSIVRSVAGAADGGGLARWMSCPSWGSGLALAGLCWLASPAVAAAARTNSLVPVLSATVSERYDSNVMLQEHGPEANRESFVTSVLPVVGAELSGVGETSYSVGLRYAPDFTLFHDLSRESYLRQIGLFDFNVKREGLSVGGAFAANYTDGTTDPPNWGPRGEVQVPSLGAVEVRNRRRNLVLKGNFNARQQIGRTFIRGVFDARIWDFMTDHVIDLQDLVQNYYDRTDINGGIDFGVKVHPLVEPYVGYRYGHQDQESQLNGRLSFANTYHRALLGLTATPAKWVSLQGEIGPSFHCFDPSTVPPDTHTTQNFLYCVGKATVRLSSNTTFKVVGGQHILPASGGAGLFENLTAYGGFDHRFTSSWRASVGCAFTDYDFNPAPRRDQQFVPQVELNYVFDRHFSAMVWYDYEFTANLDDTTPDADDRVYSRHVVGVGVKATF